MFVYSNSRASKLIKKQPTVGGTGMPVREEFFTAVPKSEGEIRILFVWCAAELRVRLLRVCAFVIVRPGCAPKSAKIIMTERTRGREVVVREISTLSRVERERARERDERREKFARVKQTAHRRSR